MSGHAYSHLYDFQKDGVDFLTKHGGGFCWDDPGLGKTRQAIVAADILAKSPILIICPNSLKQWWQEEIRNVLPKASIVVAGVGGRFGPRNNWPLPKPTGSSKLAKWWIVHYAGVRLNEALQTVPWATVILDEAHYIKNRKSQRTKAVMLITPKYASRIGLTATPFGNNPADLWSQLRWMAPDVRGLRSYWKFFDTFVDHEWEVRGRSRYRKIKGGKHFKILANVMAGYGVRRGKATVASQLPPITDTIVPLALEGRQRILYNQLKCKANVELSLSNEDGSELHRLVIPNVLARMMRMEQALSHPWSMIDSIEGAKLTWLKEWIIGYKQQVVIATRFKASAYRIADWLKSQKWPISQGQGQGHATSRPATRCRNAITGDISVGARHSIIKDWKDGKHQCIVGTIDTIGIGLSFPEAHSMVLFDILTSVIKMDQVRHRIHRLTSKHPVQIIYPIISGTTNELMLQAFTHKWKQLELVRAFIQHIHQGE